MLGTIASITSGLMLGQQRLDASTHNTATLHPRPSAALRVEAREGGQGGVGGVVSAEEGPSNPVVESVEQISIGHQVVALKKALQTQSEMVGRLLDLEA